MGLLSSILGFAPETAGADLLAAFFRRIDATTIPPERMTALLAELKAAEGDENLTRAVLEAFATANRQALEDVTLAVLRHAGTGDVGEVLSGFVKREEGRITGLLVPELDRSLTRYAQRRGRENAITEDLIVEWSLATRPGGRPRAILEAMLGKALFRPSRGLRHSQSGRYWQEFFPRTPGPPVNNSTLAAFVRSRANFHAKIRQIRALRVAGGEDLPTAEVLIERFENYLKQQVDSGGVNNGFIRLDGEASLADFDEVALKALIGNQQLGPNELVHRLFDAHEILEGTAKAAGLDTVNDLFGMPGVFGLFQKVVSRSGHQHGYVFELEVIVDAFKGARSGTTDIAEVVLQVRIGTKEGPDIVLVRRGATRETALIQDAKSYGEIARLLGPGGKMMRQTGNTLRRMAAEVRASGRSLQEAWGEAGAPLLAVQRTDGNDAFYEDALPIEMLFRFIVDQSRLTARSGVDAVAHARGLRDADLLQLNRAFTLDTPVSSDPGLRDYLLTQGTKALKGATEPPLTVAARLQEIIDAATPELTFRELAIIRMVMDDAGAVDDELVAFLKAHDTITFEAPLLDPQVIQTAAPPYTATDSLSLDDLVSL